MLLLASFMARPASAQMQDYMERIGPPDWTPSVQVNHGSVGLGNGNLHIEIPMASYPQRGGSNLSVRLVYNSRLWTAMYWTGGLGYFPALPFNANGGWSVLVGPYGYATPCNTQFHVDCGGAGYASNSGQCSDNGVNFYNFTQTSGFYWQAPDGTMKTFTSLLTIQSPVCNSEPDTPTAVGYADDGSGYYMSVASYTQATVYDPRGRQVYPGMEDTNGNSMGMDNLGRTTVSVSQNGNITYINVPDPLAPQGSATHNIF